MKEAFQLQPNKTEKPNLYKNLITKVWETGTQNESVTENMRDKIITQLEEEEKGSFKRGTNKFYNLIIGETKANQLTKQEWSICRDLIDKEIKKIEDNEKDIMNIIAKHEAEKIQPNDFRDKPFSDKSFINDARKLESEEIKHQMGEDL